MEESRAKVWEAEKKVGVERIERCMRQGGGGGRVRGGGCAWLRLMHEWQVVKSCSESAILIITGFLPLDLFQGSLGLRTRKW